MSILDWIITFVVWLLENTIGRFPDEFAEFSLASLQGILDASFSTLTQAFSLVSAFLPIKLILTLLGVIIVAEILLHFGWKAIKYVIQLIRG